MQIKAINFFPYFKSSSGLIVRRALNPLAADTVSFKSKSLPIITPEKAYKLLEENTYKSYNGTTAYEIPIKIGSAQYIARRLDGGGTKTVYEIEHNNEKVAIALANSPERWKNVLNEPQYTREIREAGLLTNDCCGIVPVEVDGKTFPALRMKPYNEHNFRIFDCKNPSDRISKDEGICDFENLTTEQACDMLNDFIDDVNKMLKNNIDIGSDSINLALTKDGKFRLYINDLPFEKSPVNTLRVKNMQDEEKMKLGRFYLERAFYALGFAIDKDIYYHSGFFTDEENKNKLIELMASKLEI